MSAANGGSSPRERGTQERGADGVLRRRFIPARAGNTSPVSPAWSVVTVHPRASGEHRCQRLGYALDAGSSPRERGTPKSGCKRVRCTRFIPARAGNTTSTIRPPARTKVHPRASGEHWAAAARSCVMVGSSPRERGTPARALRRCRPLRFIPARAGNTSRNTSKSSTAPVHPRASGEHADTALSQQLTTRFIPARAGNTLRASNPAPVIAVHPRASGEHSRSARSLFVANGSSPRERGTPQPMR